MSVVSTHNAGFFSCCAVKLTNIVDYINFNKKLPETVDSSQQFTWYKNDKNKDITFDYFEHYENISNNNISFPINYHWEHQYINYLNLDYKRITPLIQKYFSPSENIKTIINTIEKKYNLIYENICVLFYRGNDKITETKLCGYEEYIVFAQKIMKTNPKVVFLIQSDETEFIELITKIFPNNSFYFKDEIRHMKKCNDTVDKKMPETNNEFSKYYLAITIIMAKCEYIIFGSGNCSEWIMFYREHNKNVLQNLNGLWYNTIDILL